MTSRRQKRWPSWFLSLCLIGHQVSLLGRILLRFSHFSVIRLTSTNLNIYGHRNWARNLGHDAIVLTTVPRICNSSIILFDTFQCKNAAKSWTRFAAWSTEKCARWSRARNATRWRSRSGRPRSWTSASGRPQVATMTKTVLKHCQWEKQLNRIRRVPLLPLQMN